MNIIWISYEYISLSLSLSLFLASSKDVLFLDLPRFLPVGPFCPFRSDFWSNPSLQSQAEEMAIKPLPQQRGRHPEYGMYAVHTQIWHFIVSYRIVPYHDISHHIISYKTHTLIDIVLSATHNVINALGFFAKPNETQVILATIKHVSPWYCK